MSGCVGTDIWSIHSNVSHISHISKKFHKIIMVLQVMCLELSWWNADIPLPPEDSPPGQENDVAYLRPRGLKTAYVRCGTWGVSPFVKDVSPIVGSNFRCFNHREWSEMVARLQSFQTEAGYWGRGRSAHERPNKPGPKWGQWGNRMPSQVEPSTRWNLWIVYEASKKSEKVTSKSPKSDKKWLQKNDKMESFTATPRYSLFPPVSLSKELGSKEGTRLKCLSKPS